MLSEESVDKFMVQLPDGAIYTEMASTPCRTSYVST